MSEDIKELRKQIEALQQEYDELDTGHSKLFKDFCEMKQENEQLQAQNGAMRGALKQARATLQTLNNLGGLGYDKHRWISEALAAIEKIGGREE